MLRQKIQKLAEKVLNIQETETEERIKKKRTEYQNKFEGVKQKEREIKEIVDEIEKLYDEWKNQVRRIPKDIANILSQKVIIKIREIKAQYLEKVLNQLLERYEEKEYSAVTLGLLISLLLNRTVNQYIKEEMEKGKELKQIEPLNVNLNTKKLKNPISLLGYENQEKSYLKITGNAGAWTAYFMKGGKLIIDGKVKGFSLSAFSQNNKGEIWYQGKKIWPRS
ncbi:MAG: hypothetical protein J7J46_09975 [Candidatus Desulfofervidus sp.]|nr:hypothetical protein [Candidatus Desulfofervidus sp.]